MKEFYKLVRDNIPKKIENNGEIAIIKILENKEFLSELRKKLIEEYDELMLAIKSNDKESIAEESGDLLEVLKTINEINGYSFEYILSLTDSDNSALSTCFQKIIEIEDKEDFVISSVKMIKAIKKLNELNNFSFFYILNIMDKKRQKSGGFHKKIFLIKTYNKTI